MTEEQIKQNADNYTESLMCENLHRTMYSSIDFIAGAHSRDEEIKGLKEMYHDMFLVLANKVEQLSNPWISVEERPKKSDVYYVRTRQGCADMAYFDSSIEKWEKGRFTDGTVTHWMPIPELEKGE